MDLNWSAAQTETRLELRRWLDSNLAAWRAEIGTERSGDTREGFAQQLLWEGRLYEAGWSAVSWPSAYGGRDGTLWDWLIFEEGIGGPAPPRESPRTGSRSWRRPSSSTARRPSRTTCCPASRRLRTSGARAGPSRTRAATSPRCPAAPAAWPAAGCSTGRRPGPPGGRSAPTYSDCSARTPPRSGHRGLTYLLVPLDLDGITVRGFSRLDGDEGFAEVFLTEAFLPDEAVGTDVVLGEVDQGWRVAVSAASTERGLLRSPGRYQATVASLLALCAERGADAAMRRRIAAAWMRADAYRLQTLQTVTALLDGRDIGSEASLAKVWWSELDIELHEIALDMLGPDAELAGSWSKGHQFSLAGPIYAGTNEVQRNIVAERVLGLPR